MKIKARARFSKRALVILNNNMIRLRPQPYHLIYFTQLKDFSFIVFL